MTRYTIREVQTKKDLRRFIKFPFELYKGCDQYVPPLIKGQEQELMYAASLKYCTRRMWLAEDEKGKVVGRICAMINPRYNEKYGTKRARFGWFDLINDMDVAKLLFDAAESWAKGEGMDEIHGPLYYNTLGRQGMLVEGFDRLSTMALIYNHPYYPEHMVKHGYAKETGWVEYRITLPDQLSEKHLRVAEYITERYGLKVVKKTKREINRERYGQKLFQLINETYCVLYGYSLLSEKQIDQFVDVYLGVIDTEMLTFIEDANGELIGAGITMPSIAKALQKCNGEIIPFGWYHLLKTMYWKKPDTLELLLIGVKPEWQNKGVNSLVFVDLLKRLRRMGFKYAETNANLETNTKVQAMWASFEKEQHKKRWVFGKEIE